MMMADKEITTLGRDTTMCGDPKLWFPMRVTYSRELKVKAELDRLKIENFIPMTYQVMDADTEHPHRELVPAINNLIFVHSTQERISFLKQKNKVLEPLRYMLDRTAQKANTIMTVKDRQMENFMRVASMTDDSVMFLDDECVIGKEGKHVQIMGGIFEGVEGVIRRVKRCKRVVVELEGIASVAIAYVPAALLKEIEISMYMKLMYITNNPVVARIAENAGVDWIFLDMEVIGKAFRQSGLNTVQNHHTVDDIKRIRKAIKKSKLLVRVNPIHDAVDNYPSSKDEIDASIEAGADILMLPYFKTVEEVKTFIHLVNGRAKTLLLLETVEAANLIDKILEVPGIDMIHLGLNDMHLELGMKFMFELLADGTVERLGDKIKAKGIPFGFGGIATLDGGALQGSMVLKEHVRLGSSMVIVSRSFCNTEIITDLNEVKRIFDTGISDLRALEKETSQADAAYLEENRKAVVAAVNKIAGTNY